MQTFVDPGSPRCHLPFEQLPRGVIKFPSHIMDAVDKERAKFGPDDYSEEFARRTLERHTLNWYYEGLPVAYKSLPDGIEVLGVGWEEVAKFGLTSADPAVKVVRP